MIENSKRSLVFKDELVEREYQKCKESTLFISKRKIFSACVFVFITSCTYVLITGLKKRGAI
jgi:hypothetical protein